MPGCILGFFQKDRIFRKLFDEHSNYLRILSVCFRQANRSSALDNFECSLGVVLSMGLGVAIVRLSRLQVASIKVFLMNKIQILSRVEHISSSFKLILGF